MGFVLFVGAILWWMDSKQELTVQGAPSESVNVASEPEQKSEIDPQLEAILLRWGRAMENVERVECQFHRFRYDEIFNFEARSVGHLSIDRDGVGDYFIEPTVIPAGTVSPRKNGAKPFDLRTEEAETLRFTKEEVTRTLGKGGIPEPTLSFEHPLAPFLLNVSRRELTRRFDVKLVSQNQDQIRLELVPRPGEPFQQNFSRVELILKRKGFVPYALRMIDPAGNSSTVHVLSDVKYEMKASK